ncbi:MAG: hypothetical protein V4632_13540 [Pseudomonadota bacterium]
MFAASLPHQARPIGMLLGGSGMRRIVERKKPEVGVLLKPRTDLCASRSMPIDAVAPPWEVDCPDLDREQASAGVIEMATYDPERILEKIRQLKQSGEIAPDELIHIERIACKWAKISRDNQEKGRRSVAVAVSHP